LRCGLHLWAQGVILIHQENGFALLIFTVSLFANNYLK
jgi:hypothetical protein